MVDSDRFVERYSEAVRQGDAALFVGAGVSRSAGFVDWRGLLRGIAEELHLDIDLETDLVRVAQFHVNFSGGRNRLDQVIMDEFTEDTGLNEIHALVARLPLKTIWTTNYDRLIEGAFQASGKRLDVKTRNENIGVTLPRRDAILYKMHGDVGDPAGAVLTKEDYETYSFTRGAFSTTLQSDLLNKTFLFLGFSFNDPNLEYVLARIRGLLGEHQREHFCIMRPPPVEADEGAERAQAEYDRRRFDLRIADLQRYGIQTVLVDEYDEVNGLLHRVDRAVRTRSVFISGSAADYGRFGEANLQALVRALGGLLVDRKLRIISGLGLGVGGLVVLGAMERMYRTDNREAPATDDLLAVRPFPIGLEDDDLRHEVWTQHRTHMLAEAGVAVFISGNREEGGVIVDAPGVMEEFALAVDAEVFPIPIGATGFAAKQIWEEVSSDQARFFGQADVAAELKVLGDPSSTVDGLLASVQSMIDKLS